MDKGSKLKSRQRPENHIECVVQATPIRNTFTQPLKALSASYMPRKNTNKLPTHTVYFQQSRIGYGANQPITMDFVVQMNLHNEVSKHNDGRSASYLYWVTGQFLLLILLE